VIRSLKIFRILAEKYLNKRKRYGLRHSYATHLLEAGTDTLLIKELLGYCDIKPTMIYTHVADRHIDKISSPLDNLWCNTQK